MFLRKLRHIMQIAVQLVFGDATKMKQITFFFFFFGGGGVGDEGVGVANKATTTGKTRV